MAQRQIPGLAEEEARRRQLRERGLAAARAYGEEAGAGVASMEEAGRAGQQRIRQQAARGLAAGLSSAPVGSGAGLAASRQSSVEAGLAGAQFGAQMGQSIAAARQQANAERLEAIQAEAEIGSQVSAQQQKMANYEKEIAQIKEEHKNWYGTEDEAGAANAIRRRAAQEEDPVIRDWLLQRARDIETEREDF